MPKIEDLKVSFTSLTLEQRIVKVRETRCLRDAYVPPKKVSKAKKASEPKARTTRATKKKSPAKSPLDNIDSMSPEMVAKLLKTLGG